MVQATPIQQVFGSDMKLNTPFMNDWEYNRRCKQLLIDKNNQNQHTNRKPHNYRVHDKVPVRNKKSNKYEEPYKLPYPITKVCTNVNVTIRRGAVQYCINIRCIKPCHE